MNRYLNSDPLPWLIDGTNPAVTYLTKKEFYENIDENELYSNLYFSELTQYLRKNLSDNILGNRKNYDLFYQGTVWFFLMAIESGYDRRTDFILETAEFICKYSQQGDGGFSFNWNPPVSVGCRTGNIVYGLLKSGIKDERTNAGLNWIIKNQRADGGWLHCPFRGLCDIIKLIFLKKSGNGHFYDRNSKISSCPVATYTCMSALSEAGNPLYAELLSSAADYFISLNLLSENDKNKTGCGLFIDPVKSGYPVMAQFDIISLLRLISLTDKFNSCRGGELFNSIIKSQNPSGRWISMNSCQGMIHESKKESRWVTLNALRMIKAVSAKDSQLEKA